MKDETNERFEGNKPREGMDNYESPGLRISGGLGLAVQQANAGLLCCGHKYLYLIYQTFPRKKQNNIKMRILIASCISMRKHLDQFEASNFGDLINDMTKKLKWKKNLCSGWRFLWQKRMEKRRKVFCRRQNFGRKMCPQFSDL